MKKEIIKRVAQQLERNKRADIEVFHVNSKSTLPYIKGKVDMIETNSSLTRVFIEKNNGGLQGLILEDEGKFVSKIKLGGKIIYKK